MNIIILTGSPHPHGTTDLLAEAFADGAVSAGHSVTRFDCAQLHLAPCSGCAHCTSHQGECVHKDGMSDVLSALMEADGVVLVTPLYYYGMAAQLKIAIDRFYAFNRPLHGKERFSCLLAACDDTRPAAMDALVAYYHAVGNYMKWTDHGMVLALGCKDRKALLQTDFTAQARQLGCSCAQ